MLFPTICLFRNEDYVFRKYGISLYASTIGSDVSTVAAKTGIPALKLECVAISE